MIQSKYILPTATDSMLKDWAWYYVLDDKGNKVLNYSNDIGNACFAAVTTRVVPKSYKTVKIIVRKDKCPFTEEGIKKWLGYVDSIGFHNTYENGEVTIPIEKYKGNRLLFDTVFPLVRYLWKLGGHEIVNNTLLKMDEEVNAGFFMEMQYAHNKVSYPYIGGHMLKAVGTNLPGISLEIWNTKLKEAANLYKHSGSHTYCIWSNIKYTV